MPAVDVYGGHSGFRHGILGVMGTEDAIALTGFVLCGVVFSIRYVLVQIGKAFRSFANGD